MKVRIGYGLGTRTATDPDRFRALVGALEDLRFDSLWLSERVTAEGPDPVVGLAVAAGMTERLKLGFSVLVLPGRNPMLLAKELASLDRLSDGRLLPAFGLGVVDPGEQQAFGVAREERGARFDEVLPLLHRFWSGEPVDHEGRFHRYEGAVVRPTPAQPHLDVWLGGLARSELRRCGRLGDGWLPSFCTPEDVAAGVPVIEEAAAEQGRSIDPEHYGALITYCEGPIPEPARALLARRRPDVAPEAVVATGPDDLRDRLQAFTGAGASKFVLLPLAEPADWSTHLGELAEAVLPLQT